MAERVRLVAAAGREFSRRAPEIVAALVAENGKPECEAWSAEVLPNLDLFAYHTRHSPRLLRPERLRLDPIAYPGKRAVVRYAPRGVLLLISPWNFPVSIPLRTLVPALVAGNTLVWKPSEHALLTGRLIAEILDVHLPPGVLELVVGAGDVGQALTALPWGRVIFTGSVPTGRAVARACAETLTPVSLELGGKDAAIVLADADLERTANGLMWGAFCNAGQNCAAIERVYVEEQVATPLRALLQDKIPRLRVRAPGSDAGDVGPLTTAAQRRVVEEQLAGARAAGAVVVGGAGSAGLTITPALVEGAPADCALLSQETFGPVLPLVVVRDADEAIGLANASPYGLTASIWTRDLARGATLARRLHTGIVTVNNHGFTAAIPAAPWTGTKDSGSGVTNGKHALYEMVRPVLYLEDRSRARRELWWYPYDAELLGVLRGMWMLRGVGLAGKWHGLRSLLRHFPRRLRTP